MVKKDLRGTVSGLNRSLALLNLRSKRQPDVFQNIFQIELFLNRLVAEFVPTGFHQVVYNSFKLFQTTFHVLQQYRKAFESFLRSLFKEFNGKSQGHKRVLNIVRDGVQQQLVLGNERFLLLQILDSCSNINKGYDYPIRFLPLSHHIGNDIHLIPVHVGCLHFLLQDIAGIDHLSDILDDRWKAEIIDHFRYRPADMTLLQVKLLHGGWGEFTQNQRCIHKKLRYDGISEIILEFFVKFN